MTRMIEEVKKEIRQFSEMQDRVKEIQLRFADEIAEEERKNQRRYLQASNMDKELAEILEEDHMLNIDGSNEIENLISECKSEINNRLEELDLEFKLTAYEDEAEDGGVDE